MAFPFKRCALERSGFVKRHPPLKGRSEPPAEPGCAGWGVTPPHHPAIPVRLDWGPRSLLADGLKSYKRKLKHLYKRRCYTVDYQTLYIVLRCIWLENA